jgi:hypothetical protein
MDTTERRFMLIGLTGYAGAGKTSVADILVRDHGFTRMRFAGPLKDMLYALGLTERELEGDLKTQPCELLGWKSPRHAMVTLGTEWGRQLIDWNMWVRALMLKIDKEQKNLQEREKYAYPGYLNRIVVDDARFLNEITALKQRGAQIWRVERPEVVALTDHPSEQEWTTAGMDQWIFNDGCLADLGFTVARTLRG